MSNKLPSGIRFLFRTYLIGLVFFVFLRFILFFLNLHSASQIPFAIIINSFITGFEFDTVMICYFISLPAVLYFISSLLNSEKINRPIYYFILFIFSISFLIAAADIPWFQYQQTRITVAALQWTNTPLMMFKIVFTDYRNYIY